MCHEALATAMEGLHDICHRPGAPAAAPVAAASSSAAAPPAPAAVPAAAEPLPPGWAEALDPTYNHTYHYNAATGERSWERPRASAASAGGEAPRLAPPGSGLALPPGWVEARDPASGVPYFYNAATGAFLNTPEPQLQASSSRSHLQRSSRPYEKY